MDRNLARRAHALLMQAMELEANDRRAFVRLHCAADPDLQQRVEQLLGALDHSSGFLETPALGERRAPVHLIAPESPQTIGDYHIVRVIGVGGMATVYEAIQGQPRRRVALKVMRHGLVQTSAVHRFQYETEVLARLQHSGIAQIFEAGAYNAGHGVSTPFFAMEYIEDASTITAYARERGLSLPERLEMFTAVCDAVQHGHQLGVIHRDLKPANILVNAKGSPKVIDFGVARSSDPQQAWITRHSDLGQLIGTLNYMSPEQCRGGGNIDIRSDVYSLGVILYELLCGRLPHDLSHAPVPEALRIIREDPPASPGTVDGALRGDIDAIITMAMDKEPDRRYPTAAALAMDIRRFLQHETIEARPPTMVYKCRLFVRRHRVLVAAGTAVILAIVAGGLLSARFAYQTMIESQRRLEAEQRALAERDAARWQAYIANIAGGFAALQAGEFQQLRCRLETAAPEHRGWEWKFLAGLAQGSRKTINAHEDMVFSLGASSDGTRLATGCRDGSIRVWDVASGECTARLEGTPGAGIMSVDLSPDGAQLVSGSLDHTVRIWDAQTGGQLCVIGEHGGPVESVAWSPRGVIASASGDGMARLWDSDSGELRQDIEDQPGGIQGVCFSEDGSLLLTWNQYGSVWLRDAERLEVLHRWSFEGNPQSATINSLGTLVAAAAATGAEGRIMIWKTADGELLHHFASHVTLSTIRSLAFSRDGHWLAAGLIHRGIALWSVPEGRMVAQLTGHEEAVSGLWFDPGGRNLFSASWDRTIRVWGVDPGMQTGLFSRQLGHDDHLITAAFSPDGAMLAAGGRENVVRLWEPDLGLLLGTLRGHSDDVYDIAFSPDSRLMATASQDKTVRLWNALDGSHLGTIHAHDGSVWTVAFTPDGRKLVSGGDDKLIQIWDLATLEPIRTLSGHTQRVIRVALSPDGRKLASVSRDHSVRLWDPDSGSLLHVLRGHEADVFAVLFSHDGRRLYSGSRDQTVRVWDPESGQKLAVLGGHGQFVTSLSLSPDGSRLAAGSWFGQVVLWDAATLETVASFRAHDLAIRDVTFAPNGRWLASASYDKTVRLFDTALSEERSSAHLKAQAQFEAANALFGRLARRYATLSELAEAIERDGALDVVERAWLRKLVLMQSLGTADLP